MKKVGILILTILVVGLLVLHWMSIQEKDVLNRDVRALLWNKQATVGIAVMTDSCEILSVNDTVSFPMLSVFKFHVALTVLDYLNDHHISLDSLLFVKASELLPNTYSPLRDRYPNQDITISIGELLRYSVALSDNNACDVLIRYVGGVTVVEQYSKKLGITDLSICATEEQMHEKDENQYLNWTTPAEMTRLMRIFLKNPLFDHEYKDFLVSTMISTSTGEDKLKGVLPADVVVGHKTGSSSRNKDGMKIADNDAGFVCLPNGNRYYIAVFVMNSYESDVENASVIADVSKLVYDFMINR